MSGRRVPAVVSVLVLGVAVLSARQGPVPSSPPAVRATSDVVTVDVSVRTGADHVGGLAATDFVLLDNGVPQHVEVIPSSTVPVDVTLIVDTNREVGDQWDNVNRQAARIVSQLRPTDRLRVWTLDTSVTEVRPLAPVGAEITLPRMVGGGLAAVYDALGAALIEPVAPDARHLIVALTNGIDTDSVLSLKTVQDLAARTDARLHVAQIDVEELKPGKGDTAAQWVTSEEERRDAQCLKAQCEPTHQFWQPHYDPPKKTDRFAPLSAVAALTGGAVDTAALFAEPPGADVFQPVYRDFQEHYVLRYTPQGVGRAGWHTIAVTIPAYPKYAIHARQGYGSETEAPASSLRPEAAPAARGLSGLTGSPVDGLMASYDRGDYTLALDTARQAPDAVTLVRDLRAVGNRWPQNPHREAVFALELSRIALLTGGDRARTSVEDWLIDEGRFVRSPLGPDTFEQDWLVAELALLIAPIRPAAAEPFLSAALGRFPDDPRLLLDAALLADQKWTTGADRALSASENVRAVAEVLAKYDAVIAPPDVAAFAAEARVRSAWVLHRALRDPEALTRLNAVSEADADPSVRYLHQLFLGHVLSALKRPTDAVAAYRAAPAMFPEAESGRVALKTGLLAAGDRPGAVALAEHVQTSPSSTADPWHLYWQGDYRHFSDLVAHLRETSR